MKKIFISLTIILFSVSAFSQLIKPVKIDSLVTISLPPGYQHKDTLGQQIYSANGLYGYMEVIRAGNPKNTTPLKKERDLNNVLKDYVKGIQGESGGGSAQNVRDTTIGTLEAKIFTLRTDDGSGNILNRNFVLIYTTEATYTFEYGYQDNRKDLIRDEYRSFLNSIKLSPELQRNDQYLSNSKAMSLNKQIAIACGAALIIIVVIILIVRRRRAKRRTRN
jgi:hypothetical protein